MEVGLPFKIRMPAIFFGIKHSYKVLLLIILPFIKKNIAYMYVTDIDASIGHVEPIPAPLEDVIGHLIRYHLIYENRRPNSSTISFFL